MGSKVLQVVTAALSLSVVVPAVETYDGKPFVEHPDCGSQEAAESILQHIFNSTLTPKVFDVFANFHNNDGRRRYQVISERALVWIRPTSAYFWNKDHEALPQHSCTYDLSAHNVSYDVQFADGTPARVIYFSCLGYCRNLDCCGWLENTGRVSYQLASRLADTAIVLIVAIAFVLFTVAFCAKNKYATVVDEEDLQLELEMEILRNTKYVDDVIIFGPTVHV